MLDTLAYIPNYLLCHYFGYILTMFVINFGYVILMFPLSTITIPKHSRLQFYRPRDVQYL